jgi:hypothetical protein
MKWETIKNRCVNIASKELHTLSLEVNWSMLLFQLQKQNNRIGFYKTQEMAKEKCYDVIDNWDIRNWKSLQERFPQAFPKGVSQIELTDKGWELF